MRYKIKILPKLFGVLVILLMTNCAKEEFFEQIKNSNDISLEQFKRETGISNFNTSLKINNNQNSLHERNPDGTYELSDFIIDTEIIKKYVVDEKVTYTFKIIPVDVVNDKIYNLTYFYKDGWQTIVLELKPTEENLSLLRQGLTNVFEGTATRLYQSDLPSPVAQWCVTINFTNSHCTGTGPCASGVCDQCELCVSSGSATICGPDEISVVYIDAGPSSSGGGPGDGTGGNGNTGSPSNPSDTEISIIPNLEELEIDIDGDPKTIDPTTIIRRLNKMTKNKNGQETIYKQKIDEYIEKLATNYVEEGVMYGTEFAPIDGESTKNSTVWSSYPLTHYITIHMHQNQYYVNGNLRPTNPVMSDQDVISTLGFYNYTGNINVTTILVSRQGTFALRVSNGNQVNDAINALDPDSNSQTSSPELDKLIAEYDNKVQTLFEAGDEDGALEGFIDFINNYQVNGQPMGLSLFQAQFDSQGNITNWVKL